MKTRFLLVHGSCHGAWCWKDVLPHLRAAGHEAQAIDLPSHGDDITAPGEVTLDAYANAIIEAMSAPTVLVGHSMAGYPITLAAARAPKRVARLIYLCAYVPVPGLSLAGMRRAGPRQPLQGVIRLADDRATFTIAPEHAPGCFYNDCPPEVAARATAQLVPQPVLPQETPLPPGMTEPPVPRHYIVCTRDQTIPPEYQARMSAGFAPDHVTDLPASHSPFLSMPDKLAQRLLEIAEAP